MVNITILYAEDNDMVRELTMDILKSEGYDVIAAKDGTEALKLFKKYGESISLFLFDIIMPGLDGNELYYIINKQKSGIPVLFCSAYKNISMDIEKLKKFNGRYIQKPYDPDTLLKEVRCSIFQNMNVKRY